MPIHEYTCEDCGQQFEELVFASTAEVPCPGCKSTRTTKLMSACRHSFAGSDMPKSPHMAPPRSSGGGCSGCSGGNCSSC